ncbi:MAG: hypothetical protein IT202_01355 [Fimbriimonadaceae bacterium]|nr:hypothetical protein [Fimbriimonadaceae bacterium]MCC6351137.1 hypothetical protein [Fimbriimonadaceae bacterium]
MSGLQAYALGPIPFDWIASAGWIGAALTLLVYRPVGIPKVMLGFVLFVGVAVAFTAFASLQGDYSRHMPSMASNPYPVYMALRVFVLAAFLSAGYCAWWLCKRARFEDFAGAIVFVGVVLSALALYIFIAQVAGLPEPPRSRAGTSGAEQATTFSYAVHRAIGTFREPSHLASFLLLPLFLSLRGKGLASLARSVMIGSALLLTGSLTGIFGAVIGLVLGAGSLSVRSPRVLGIVVTMLGALALGSGVFVLVMALTGGGQASIFSILLDRVLPMLEGGAAASNRAFVYTYVASHPPAFIGVGLGNSNLLFADALNLKVIPSFSSLYLSVAYGLGYPGIALLAYALLAPVGHAFLRVRRSNEVQVALLLSAYVGWMVAFAAQAEELNVSFGLVLGLLAWQTSKSARAPLQAEAEAS